MGRFPAAFLLVALLVPAPAAAAAPSRFLVSFEEGAPLVGEALEGARVLEAFPFAGVALLEGPLAVRAAVARLPGIAGVYDEEPIALLMERERDIVDAEPPAGARWPTGGSVTVAMVDSGIDGAHPAFDGRVAASVRISRGGVVSAEAGDSDGHGTHVAGIVAGDGAGSANARHRGIAPNARLVGVDISDSFTTTNAVRAFAWIAENAARYDIRVVSNSWGREKEDAHFDPNDPVIRASDALVADGIVVVFSAGNRGRDGASTLTTEATNPRVLTVGAAGASGRPESYSSRGPPVDARGVGLPWTKPDVMAPGSAVVSTRAHAASVEEARSDEERYYTVMNGTSMAAPQAAAAVALLLDLQPSLTPAQAQALLQRSAADLGPAGADADTGYGMLDVAAALREAARMVAGEERVVVETRVPLRQRGDVVAAAGQVVLASGGPKLPPAARVTLPLVLPPGATSVELWFNWSSQGAFDVDFVGGEGAVAFEAEGGQSLRVTTPASPGSWRVEATPLGAAAHTPYTLEGWVVVREEHLVEVAAESHGRPAAASSAFVAVPSAGMHPLDVVARAPGLVLGLVATGATGIALALRKKRT